MNPLFLMPVDEKKEEAYVWEMYPYEAKILQRYAKELLELEDCERSFIYDEYPDKFLFWRMVHKIKQRYLMEQMKQEEEWDKALEGHIEKFAQVILVHEIMHKRNERKKTYGFYKI